MRRAILLASAMATRMRGLSEHQLPSHVSSGMPRRQAPTIAAMAPTTSNRRMSCWPAFETFPSRALPPDEFCRGTRPS